jgi:hypothetical protein
MPSRRKRKRVPVPQIHAGVSYHAFYFDPASGKQVEVGDITADSMGSWLAPFTPTFADWVLVIEKKR